jgi:hypothetical protein
VKFWIRESQTILIQNNFDIIDKGDNWSMKYQNLEYKGHFSSDIKCVERINGTTYSKIEFVLETEKRIPNRTISLMGPFKNEFEKKKNK